MRKRGDDVLSTSPTEKHKKKVSTIIKYDVVLISTVPKIFIAIVLSIDI